MSGTLPWWMDVDRSELQTACSALLGSGGLIAVSGSGLAGRNEARLLATRALERQGRPCVQVAAPASGVSFGKIVLRNLISGAEERRPRPAGAITSATINAGVSERLLADLACETLAMEPFATEGVSVVVSAIGLDVRPREVDLSRLRAVADRVGGAWVLMGAAEVAWRACRPDAVVTLGKFRRTDVADALQRGERDGHLPADGSRVVLERLFPAGRSAVSAQAAYTALRGVST